MNPKPLTFPFPLFLAFPALILSSCIESDSAYTLNANGTGKVTHQIKFKKQAGNWTDEDPARTFALGFVRGTRGVEAWDDVHYRMTDGGEAVEFRGTAYFRDINRVSLGSFLKDGDLQQLPIPQVSMKKKDGKHRFALKDPDPTRTRTKLAVTVKGLPAPDGQEAKEGEGDGEHSGIDAMMAASFALSGDIRTSIRVNGSVAETAGFEREKLAGQASFHYRPNLGGKEGRKQFEERWTQVTGDMPSEAQFDEVFAGGIFENATLQKVVSGQEPPFAVAFEIDGDSFRYGIEVGEADLKLTRQQAEGWKKLESLDL